MTKNRSAVAFTLTAAIVGVAIALAPTVAANAITGPVACNQMAAPPSASFFGVKNCYNLALIMTKQYKLGGVAHICVQPKAILWSDQAVANVQLGMIWSSSQRPYISLVAC